MLKNYIQYINESAEAVGKNKNKNPEQKIILSDKFKKILNEIQNFKQSNISKRLLELEDSDRLFNFSYVDIEPDGENISYLQSNRIERFINENKPITEFWTSKMRTKQRVGRFISQILPNFKENSVEKFVKKFKTIVKEENKEYNFELVEGDEIVYWYDYRNYENVNGTMGSSCMSGPESSRYLNIYRNNPNVCKMLILKNTDGDKIKGRALIWKLSEPKDTIFMDRVYTNDDEDELIFIKYAKKNGWLYKEVQMYGETFIIDPSNNSKTKIKMEVNLDNTNFNQYPYLDTLRFYYKNEKKLLNYIKRDGNYYTLTDTEGYYAEFDGDDNDDYDPLVYDGYNNRNIPENEATWCKYDVGYILSRDAIRLSYNNTYAYPNSPHVVWSTYTNKHYAKEDCVYSDSLQTWIWNKYVVDVYHDKKRKSKPSITHRFELNKTIGKVDEYYYDLDILYIIDSKIKIDKKGKSVNEITYGFKEDLFQQGNYDETSLDNSSI